MNVTPVILETILHIYYNIEPPARINTPAVTNAIDQLLANVLIAVDKGSYTCTQKGEVWVKMLCATPLPVRSYVDPRSVKK